MDEINKLIIIGNGFDLAHGLQTSYKDFLDWYMCKAFNEFCSKRVYTDPLIEIQNKYASTFSTFKTIPKTCDDVLNLLSSNQHQSLSCNSNFLNKILNSFQNKNWVDIERYYFLFLKGYFSNRNLERTKVVGNLNRELDFLIAELTNYIKIVNKSIRKQTKLISDRSRSNVSKLFNDVSKKRETKFLNFNYTDTLCSIGYAVEKNIIFIHGRAADVENNPIIFGYGDESDPAYQDMEDSGENIYLEHIKSFGYFKTNNYHSLLSYIDSAPYIIHIVGHSCGLSDRILLREVFEHPNCQAIDIFYHVRNDGSDNFKEITQEISRHFNPNNKNIMRRKIINKNIKNIIPQHKIDK